MNQYTQIAPEVWRIDDDFVSVYLIRGAERSLFIDAGVGGLDLPAIARELSAPEPMLAVTHADGDHIGGIDAFPRFYMHPADFWYLAKHRPGAVPMPLWEGDELELGGRTIEAIHIPGHTPGGLVFLDRKNRQLFAGDAVQVNTPIFLFGDARNIPAYISGLERLYALRYAYDLIFPGHGEGPLTPDAIPRITEACRRYLRGELTGVKPARDPHLPCLLYTHEDVQLYV